MKIIIAGGGASGLMAALTAKSRGAEDVLILERGGEIGKKILSTGSGRCNLTNENQSPDCYHSVLPGSFAPVLSQFSKKDTVRFFEESGLHLKAKNGYYYPRNAQALSVRDFLRDCCRKVGVRVELNKKITGVKLISGQTGKLPQRTGEGINQGRKIPCTDGKCREGSSGYPENVQKNGKDDPGYLKTKRKAEPGKEKSGMGGFRITCEDGTLYTCDRLILAGGGKAAPQTGSDGGMYAIARKLGHTVIAPVPALTPLCVKKDELKFFKTAGGTRADGRITLLFDREEKNGIWSDTGNEIRKVCDNSGNTGEETLQDEAISAVLGTVTDSETVTDCGEIQFVDYGLSGIPAFNVSAAAGRALLAGKFDEKCAETDIATNAVHAGAAGNRKRTNGKTNFRGNRVWAEVDLLPEISPELLRMQFDSYRERFPEDTFRMWLRGYLPSKLAEAVLALAGIPPALYLRKCSDEEEERLLRGLKGSRFELSGTGAFEKAQTTSGGVDMREVDLNTLESRCVPGLYFAGEILDVDGICGGYNLQWAWSSGYVAGKSAASEF